MPPPTDLDSLLRPSLAHGSARRAPYSFQATYLVSFFGGLTSAGLINAVNAWLLRRPKGEFIAAVAMSLAGIGFMLYIGRAVAADMAPEWITSNRQARTWNRFAGLAAAGVFYLLQKKDRRALSLSDAVEPNGWKGGLALLLVGVGFNFSAIWLGGQIGE